ncbi:MAG: thioredoxin family protein, partial [Myxococcota bacterium]
MAIIGANSAREEGKRANAFFLSLAYVLGMVLPASGLGILVAMLGELPFMLGGLFQSTVFLGFLVVLFGAMSASMFGAFELTLPARWQTRLSQVQGKGYRGVFVLGMIGVVLSTACSGPVLLGLFAFVAQTRSVWWGVLLPAALILGMGIPFLLLGTGVVSALPRSGTWMVEVKKVFGFVLLGATLYYAKFLLVSFPVEYAFLVAVALLASAVSLGAIRLAHEADSFWTRCKQVVGLVLLLAGGTLFVGTWWKVGVLFPPTSQATLVVKPVVRRTQSQDRCLPPPQWPTEQPYWLRSESQARACAKRLHRPLLLDFWATWCVSCKKLDKKTFSDPRVVRLSRFFVLGKIDQTKRNKKTLRLQKRYSIGGLPWVRFVSAQGKLYV